MKAFRPELPDDAPAVFRKPGIGYALWAMARLQPGKGRIPEKDEQLLRRMRVG